MMTAEDLFQLLAPMTKEAREEYRVVVDSTEVNGFGNVVPKMFRLQDGSKILLMEEE